MLLRHRLGSFFCIDAVVYELILLPVIPHSEARLLDKRDAVLCNEMIFWPLALMGWQPSHIPLTADTHWRKINDCLMVCTSSAPICLASFHRLIACTASKQYCSYYIARTLGMSWSHYYPIPTLIGKGHHSWIISCFVEKIYWKTTCALASCISFNYREKEMFFFTCYNKVAVCIYVLEASYMYSRHRTMVLSLSLSTDCAKCTLEITWEWLFRLFM